MAKKLEKEFDVGEKSYTVCSQSSPNGSLGETGDKISCRGAV